MVGDETAAHAAGTSSAPPEPLQQLPALARALATQPGPELIEALFAPFRHTVEELTRTHAAEAPPALQRALLALGTWISLAAQRAIVLAAREAGERATRGHAPRSLRQSFQLLVACGDRAWLEIAAEDGFTRALGGVINESARARLGRASTGDTPPVAPMQDLPPLAGIEKLMPEPNAYPAELARLQQRLQRARDVLAALDRVHPGVTPRESVWSDEVATLNRLGGEHACRGGTPVLVVYALVNREHVLDLEENRSLLRELQQQRLDVWLLAWNPPTRYRPELTLERYVEGAIGRAVHSVLAQRRRSRLNLLGVCQGGTFALMYAARHPGQVRRLVTLVTPVDFEAEGFLLSRWLRHVDTDLLVEAYGNLPGSWLNLLFLALRPLQLGSAKYLDALDRLADPAEAASFLRMERWLNDSPDQAGAAFAHYARELVRANGFVNGTLTLAGEHVNLHAMRCAVLNVAAARDHIVPPASALRLGELLDGCPHREEVLQTGHIGLFTSRQHLGNLAVLIAGFVRARSDHAAIRRPAC